MGFYVFLFNLQGKKVFFPFDDFWTVLGKREPVLV